MAEYIEREALISEFKRLTLGENSLIERFFADGVYAVLDTFPAADVVEVVRCKDCKYFGRDLGYGKHDCKKYEMPYCLEDDFCSYGERKDGSD